MESQVAFYQLSSVENPFPAAKKNSFQRIHDHSDVHDSAKINLGTQNPPSGGHPRRAEEESSTWKALQSLH